MLLTTFQSLQEQYGNSVVFYDKDMGKYCFVLGGDESLSDILDVWEDGDVKLKEIEGVEWIVEWGDVYGEVDNMVTVVQLNDFDQVIWLEQFVLDTLSKQTDSG